MAKVCENGAINAYNAFLLPIMYKGSVLVPLVQNLSISYSRNHRCGRAVQQISRNGLGHGCVNSNQIPSCNKVKILAK